MNYDEIVKWSLIILGSMVLITANFMKTTPIALILVILLTVWIILLTGLQKKEPRYNIPGVIEEGD